MHKTEEELAISRNRVILLSGSIGDELIRNIEATLLTMDALNARSIKMLINSSGGELECALHLYDFIRLMRSEITAIVIGQCSSSALAILQACKRRMMTENAFLILHNGTITRAFRCDSTVSENLDSLLGEVTGCDNRYKDIIKKRSGMTAEQLEELMKAGSKFGGRIDAATARRYSLVDNVADSSFRLFTE
jgi:ATP-dependent Clp protease, protease subunit